MPELAEVLKLLGLTTPFVYASATYGFFHWLDGQASDPAKSAISAWLEPKEHDRAAVAAAVLEMFDKVYTRPLLAWRAFFRSACITIAVGAIFLLEAVFLFGHFRETLNAKMIILLIVFGAPPKIVLDYGALFIIRRFLASGNLTVVKSLLLGPAIGIAFCRRHAMALAESIEARGIEARPIILRENI